MIKKFKYRDRRHRSRFCRVNRLCWLFRALEKRYNFFDLGFGQHNKIQIKLGNDKNNDEGKLVQALNVARISGFFERQRKGRRFISKIRSYCVITSRSRAVFKAFRLSRFVF